MCDHSGRLLDDYHTGDTVCCQCGVVVDRLLGAGGDPGYIGPGRFRNFSAVINDDCYGVYDEGVRGGEEDWDLERRLEEERRKTRGVSDGFMLDLIERVLVSCGLDGNAELKRRIMLKYNLLYRSRTRPTFRKTEFRARAAAAFSVMHALIEERMPRPPDSIALAFGLARNKRLLNAGDLLDLSQREKSCMKESDYTLPRIRPEDYVDVICSNLGVPFSTAGRMRLAAEKAEWIFNDRMPTTVCAAVMIGVMRIESGLNENIEANICELLAPSIKLSRSRRTVEQLLKLMALDYPQIFLPD